GSWSNFVPLAGSGAALGVASRYLQYRTALTTTNPDQTPALQAVTFQYDTAPVAANDTYSARKNVPLTVAAPGGLANDTHPESDPLTAVLVSGPAHGTLTLNPNGSFTYTPATDYTGTDSFTYKANDALALSNVATVSFTVTAPVAGNDSYSTP